MLWAKRSQHIKNKASAGTPFGPSVNHRIAIKGLFHTYCMLAVGFPTVSASAALTEYFSVIINRNSKIALIVIKTDYKIMKSNSHEKQDCIYTILGSVRCLYSFYKKILFFSMDSYS